MDRYFHGEVRLKGLDAVDVPKRLIPLKGSESIQYLLPRVIRLPVRVMVSAFRHTIS